MFNIGNHAPVELLDFVHILEDVIGKKAIVELYPMQDGDVPETYADIEPLKELLGFSPNTSVRKGLTEFVNWYKAFYGSKQLVYDGTADLDHHSRKEWCFLAE